MIKVTITKQEPKVDVKPFPKLMKLNNGAIVFFTEYNKGIYLGGYSGYNHIG
jgi:hypothetical protein